MRYLSLLLILVNVSANAGLVGVNAGDHPAGTDLSEVLPGANMALVTNYGVVSGHVDLPVIAVTAPAFLDAGPNLIGQGSLPQSPFDFNNLQDTESCLETGICLNGQYYHAFNALRVSFDAPTNYVGVRVHFSDAWIDGALLRAFNSAGDVVATCRVYGPKNRAPQYGYYPTPTSPTCGRVLRRFNCNQSGTRCDSEVAAYISRAYPDIAYVLWGGEAFSATGSAISRINYRQFSADCTVPTL